MKTTLAVVSGLALLATIAPPALYLAGGIDLQPMKVWMAAGTVAWFAATPFWSDRGR